MSYEIQPKISCENCIKCGARPVVDQSKKKGWEIKCPNKACKNVIASALVDFNGWNRLNKRNINIAVEPATTLKRTA